MKRIALVVLDMAGTTVDEDNAVYKTVRNALSESGYDLPLDTVLEQGAGKEKYQAIYDILHGLGLEGEYLESTARKIHSRFRPMLERAYRELEVRTYPGVEAFFKSAREHGVKVVLNTGYDAQTALGLLEKLGWQIGEQIDGVVTADHVKEGRPGPGMILEAMRLFGITDPLTVLKAGDSAIDIEEGKNAGCGLTIGVLTGAQTREQLQSAGPDYIVHSVADLQGLLFG